MLSFQVSLVRPDALIFSGEADQVDLPGAEGEMGVLAGHAPIVTILRPGIVKVIANDQDEKFVVMGGVAEFSKEELMILADSAARIEDFDVAGARPLQGAASSVDRHDRDVVKALRFENDREGEVMTTFDKREQAFEAQFVHDEEMRFKAVARSNKLLGNWAAARLDRRSRDRLFQWACYRGTRAPERRRHPAQGR